MAGEENKGWLSSLMSAFGIGSDKKAQEEAAQKAREGIRKTRENRGNNIRRHGKEAAAADREIEAIKKAMEAKEESSRELLELHEKEKQAAAKKLAELEEKKRAAIAKKQSLIDHNNNKRNKGETGQPASNAPATSAEAAKEPANSGAPKVEQPTSAKVEPNIGAAPASAASANTAAEATKTADKAKRPSVWERASKGELFKGALKSHQEEVAGLKTQLETANKQDASTPADSKLNKEAIEKNLKEAEDKLSKAGDKAYKKLSYTQQVTGRLAGNFGKNGGSMWVKGARGGAALGSAAYFGKKGIEIFSPELDEKGERKEGLAMTAIKATAALAATAGLLLYGGKNRAMSV